jgi:hypothetical protein
MQKMQVVFDEDSAVGAFQMILEVPTKHHLANTQENGCKFDGATSLFVVKLERAKNTAKQFPVNCLGGGVRPLKAFGPAVFGCGAPDIGANFRHFDRCKRNSTHPDQGCAAHIFFVCAAALCYASPYNRFVHAMLSTTVLWHPTWMLRY